VGPGTSVRQAIGLMALHDVSQLPVIDGSNSVGSVTEWALTARGLADPKTLEGSVSDVMEAPFPVVEADRSAESIVKLLSKSNPAVLVRSSAGVQGIVTRSDLLKFLMAR
jgi:cystathionine beta-synthase